MPSYSSYSPKLTNLSRSGSHRRHSHPSTDSITRFTANSLTTSTYRWLCKEAWDDRHLTYISQKRPNCESPLFSPIPYVSHKKLPRVGAGGPWILEAVADHQLQAWIEIQIFTAGFTTVHVLVSDYSPAASTTLSTPQGWNDAAVTLAFMLSGIMIMTQADILNVFPAAPAAALDLTRLATSGWGEAKSIWTPATELHALANLQQTPPRVGFHQTMLKIDPAGWQDTTFGAEAFKNLAYLIKRTASLQQKATVSAPTKRRRGLFRRLFR